MVPVLVWKKFLYWRWFSYGLNPTVIKGNLNWTLAMKFDWLRKSDDGNLGSLSSRLITEAFWPQGQAQGHMETGWKCKLFLYAKVSLNGAKM